MPGRGRPADNRSRNCGTPQGAAPLARGASAVKWDMGYGILGLSRTAAVQQSPKAYTFGAAREICRPVKGGAY
jgi:hypothetical protein